MAKTHIQEPEETSESYISIGLGLLVVVVVGILLYNYFTQKSQTPDETAQEAEQAAQEATMSAKPGTTYTVVEGDTLWSIAEKSYNSGYNWTDIARANNLTNSDALEAGQQLMIPEATPILPEGASSPTPEPDVAVASPEPTVVPSPTPVAEASEAPAASPVAQASPVMQGATITGTTYTIVAGDTLWDIACRAYGDCYAWSKVATENKLVNPNLIHPGNELTLPRG